MRILARFGMSDCPGIAAAVHAREAVVGLLLKGVGAMTAIGASGFLILVIAGPWLFTAIAHGFASFGVYALARARYPDRDPSS